MNAYARTISDALVESHRHLCRRAAYRFLRRGLELRDLEQVAAIGLIKASRRYEAANGTPFEAYARIMMRGELMHYVRDYEHAVRLPRRLRALDRKCGSVEEALTRTLEREPTRLEIARALGVELAELHELARARNAVLGAGDAWAATDPDSLPAPCPAATASRADDRLLAERALRELVPLERAIVVGVYVLGLTQADIARRLSLGSRQVHRIHRNALARMHAALAGPAA